MADETTASTVIAAPPDAVLAVIADVASYPQWTAEIKDVTVVQAGANGRPQQAVFSMSAGGMSDSYTLAYDWADDGVSWHLVEPSALQKSQSGSYRLTPTGDGTEVTYRLRIDAKLPMIGPMRRKIEKRIIDAALKELKKRVESHP